MLNNIPTWIVIIIYGLAMFGLGFLIRHIAATAWLRRARKYIAKNGAKDVGYRYITRDGCGGLDCHKLQPDYDEHSKIFTSPGRFSLNSIFKPGIWKL